jgi:hypothetical protein
MARTTNKKSALPKPSTLYKKAYCSLLSERQKEVDNFTQWLLRTPTDGIKIGKHPVDTHKLLSNIRREAFLTGNAPFGSSGELKAFLEQVGAQTAGVKGAEKLKKYFEVCDKFQLKGLKIPSDQLPATLFRYISRRETVEKILETVGGIVVRSGKLPPTQICETIAENWRDAKVRKIDVGLGRPDSAVFATFNDESVDSPRTDAGKMARALALPCVLPSGVEKKIELYEMTYRTNEVNDLRFSTIADAGDSHLFDPAEESPPDPTNKKSCYGWTQPYESSELHRQPEIVHSNKPANILLFPPRFVGEFEVRA